MLMPGGQNFPSTGDTCVTESLANCSTLQEGGSPVGWLRSLQALFMVSKKLKREPAEVMRGLL